MAIKVVRVMSSDLDGSPADETVRFSIDGKPYTIDLTKEQAKTLRDSLREYTTAAKKGRGGRAAPGEAAEIRAWARENNVDVPERGRIPKSVRDQYTASK